MNNQKTVKLAGAKFAVYNECGEKVCEGYTNGDGELCFDLLPLGVYHVKELKAPDGYMPCREDYCITLTSEDRDKTLTVINERMRGRIRVFKLGTL